MTTKKITSYSELEKLADSVETIVKAIIENYTAGGSLTFVRYGYSKRITIDIEHSTSMYGLSVSDIARIYDKVRPILLENPLNMFCWVTARGWKKGGLNPDAIEATPILRIMFDI